MFVDRPNFFFLPFFLPFISPLSSSVKVERRHTQIENRSNVDVPGRYIFRVDEWIQPGGCMNFDFGDESKLAS
jgi:hypothetical protein